MVRPAISKIPGARRVAQLLRLIPRHGGRQFVLEMLPKGSIGAEIGVHLGDFSQRILDSVSPRELHLIDPWEYQASDTYKLAWYGGGAKGGQRELDDRHSRVLKRFKQDIRAGRVKVHRGYSTEILSQFPDRSLDWVYIDGNHMYDFVKQDLALSLRKVKPGGFITGDDYTEEGWWEGGVKKAVDEFAGGQAVRLIELRNQQFVFRRADESRCHEAARSPAMHVQNIG
jgi:hypothetical protein